MESLLIVGSSLAGVSAARSARAQGFEGSIHVIGNEPERPYDRPPLSKDFLAGRITREDLALEGDEEDLDVVWDLGVAAIGLDPTTRTVALADGRRLSADGVVLATGSSAITIPELAHLANVFSLRSLDDAERLRGELTPGRRLVVIGAGLIGSEVASTAQELGVDVTIVTRDAAPLARVYGDAMASHMSALHDRHGVELIRDARVAAFEQADGRLVEIELDNGRSLATDVLLLGIGARANVGWLADSGLDIDGAIQTDEYGRTSAPGIVAVGDCAAWLDVTSGTRKCAQHWTDALERPKIAVAALLGRFDGPSRPYVPYFWSHQYGAQIQFAGSIEAADSVVVEDGNPEFGAFLAVYRRGETPVAVLGVSYPRLFMRWRKFLVAAQRVSIAA